MAKQPIPKHERIRPIHALRAAHGVGKKTLAKLRAAASVAPWRQRLMWVRCVLLLGALGMVMASYDPGASWPVRLRTVATSVLLTLLAGEEVWRAWRSR
jgi:hypothetical protein